MYGQILFSDGGASTGLDLSSALSDIGTLVIHERH